MKTPESERFGRQLKDCRELSGVTQEELALAIGLQSESSVSHYENGENSPSRERLDDIVRYLRERGAPQDCLDKIYAYSGYLEPEIADPVLVRIKNTLDSLNWHPSSFQLFKETLEETVADWERYCNALSDLRIGNSYEAQRDLQKLLHDTSIEMAHRERLRIRVLRALAEACQHVGAPTEGVNFLKEAVSLCKKWGKIEQKALAETLQQRGNIYRRWSKWEKARSDYYSSYRVYKDIEFDMGESQKPAYATVERKIAGIQLFQGQASKALVYCDRSITLFRELGEIEEECNGRQHKAWAYSMLGRWDEALAIHKDVLDILQTCRVHPITLAKSRRYLGDVYRMCRILDAAEKTYDDAIGDLQAFYKGNIEKDLLVYGMILLGQGAVYRARHTDIGKANYFFNKSLRIHLRLGARFHEALARNEIGILEMGFNNFSRAQLELSKAKGIFEELDSIYYVVAQLINLAELEYLQGNLPKSREYVTSAIEQAEKHSFYAHLVRAQLRLADINLAEPDEQQPLDLHVLAFRTARYLNPYIAHEVLSWIASQPRVLDSEDALNADLLRLTNIILTEWEDPSKSDAFPEESKRVWLRELSEFRTSLEKSIST